MVLNWIITLALCGSVWSSLGLPALTVLCWLPALSLAFYITSCHSFALLPWGIWEYCLRALPPLGTWALGAPRLLSPWSLPWSAWLGSWGMSWRESRVIPGTCMFLSHKYFLMWLSTTARAGDTIFGVFIVTGGIPTATMEMCRRAHKPVSVVHGMRASDPWSQELRGPFLTWLSAKVFCISVLVSCLVSCVFCSAPRGNISCAFMELYSCVIVTPGVELTSCWKTLGHVFLSLVWRMNSYTFLPMCFYLTLWSLT